MPATRASADERALNRPISGCAHLDSRPDQLVDPAKRMERHRGERMMLDVKRHLPGERPHEAVGVRRAGVRERIVVCRAARVLGQQIHPEERLPEHRRHDPVDQGGIGPEDQRGGENGGIDRPENPRFADDGRSLAFGHERLAHPAGRRVPQRDRNTLDPVGDAGDKPKVTPDGGRRRPSELGVARRVLREAVMLEVKGTEELGRQHEEGARDPADGVVEPAARESRPVHALVQGAEQEIEHDALDHERRQQPEPSAAHEYQRRGCSEQEDVTQELRHPERIGALRQAPQGVAIDAAGIGPELFLGHQPDSSTTGAVAEL